MCAAFKSPYIDTHGLKLRPPKPADAARIAELCDDFDIVRMTSRMPWPYTRADAEIYLEAIPDKDPAHERIFMIDAPGEGLVGCMGLFRSEHSGLPEIGYWIGRPYWGRGYATEAAGAALIWAKDCWRKKLVTAGHFADNPASGSVLQKVGFLYTGEVRAVESIARGGLADLRMMVWLA